MRFLANGFTTEREKHWLTLAFKKEINFNTLYNKNLEKSQPQSQSDSISTIEVSVEETFIIISKNHYKYATLQNQHIWCKTIG